MPGRVVVAVGAVAALLLGGCGSSVVGLDAGLGLPQTASPVVLATTTIYTSPDGGIYRNPNRLDVVLVMRHSVAAIAAQLGSSASGWSVLERFGDFTLVAVQLRDNGKVSSDPQLNDLQMASDYAPEGTSTGPLRHFYHPTYPLAMVSTVKPGDGCSVHLDPGRSALAILVYPPVNLGRTMVWGAFGDFVLTVPTGGAVPVLDGTLQAVACVSPPSGPAPRPTPP